jgi:hypothetical protein
MSSLKAAVMAELAGAPAVGPGVVVAGSVISTVGRVVSAVAPVVNCQVYGPAKATPVVKLLAPVSVAV